MRKKLGIGTIEINKKFKSKEEAFKYAKRLREYIRYLCKNKANIDWFAQAMIVVSNNRGNASYLHYDINKKPGRPKKKLRYSKYELEWYKGNIKIDWHLHILLVSSPSYAFRNEIKKYIDKNWNNVSNVIEENAFNNNDIKTEYVKATDINNILISIGLKSFNSIEYDETLNDFEGINTKGYRIKTNYASSIILYLDGNNKVICVRWADKDYYINGNILGKFN
jgi:hypothetical protein